MYTCPMHPDVISGKFGRCPKCGMELVIKNGNINKPSTNNLEEKGLAKLRWVNYIPLVVIIGLILATSLTLSFRDFQLSLFTLEKAISYFMIGFFLTFSGFKLLDLKGFAQGYFSYDLLARRIFAYGYVYPLIELFFGLAMILSPQSNILLLSEFLVMSFSGLGVVNKLLAKERFQCVCLGTFLKVPLTYVTLVEDFGMAALALLSLLI